MLKDQFNILTSCAVYPFYSDFSNTVTNEKHAVEPPNQNVVADYLFLVSHRKREQASGSSTL